ncbi:MAG: S41 family peptidase [Candidatus Kapaibacteriota bacterium]
MGRFLLSLLIILYSTESLLSNDSLNSVIEVQVQKFRNILEVVKENYYKKDVDFVGISENAFNTLLQSLDKFSQYFSAPQYKAYKDSYKGSTLGIGVQFFRRGDSLMVFNVVKGSPADSVGLQPGDKIIYINHEYCIGKDANFANKKIQGSPNEITIITVKKDGALKEFAIPLKEIEIPSVIAKTKFDRDIGYIRFNRFALSTMKELTSSIDSLMKESCKFFVFDLRGNTGGYLDEVISIAKLFLKKGDTVVIVSGKGDNHRVYYCESDGKYCKLPFIVLVDENTASAAEIFASTFQDNDRSIVLGERTYGKGLIQKNWEFKDGSAFRITTGEYLTPLGRNIQKETVEKVELGGLADLTLPNQQKENIEALIKNFGVTNNLPVYTTKKGRTLLGGGGVFPDFIFISDTTPPYLKKLKSNGFVNDFVLRYFIEDNKTFQTLKRLSFSKFVHNFEILDNAVASFKQYLIQRNAFLDNYFTNEYEKILLELKGTLGYILFGDIGYYSVVIQKDKILQKVRELRVESEKMVKQ